MVCSEKLWKSHSGYTTRVSYKLKKLILSFVRSAFRRAAQSAHECRECCIHENHKCMSSYSYVFPCINASYHVILDACFPWLLAFIDLTAC